MFEKPNTLEKRLFQLIISRLDGENISSVQYQDSILELAGKGIGGFIIFGGRKPEVREFIFRTQSHSEIPLFIASDIERGVRQQIEGTTAFPCQMAVCAAIDKNAPEGIKILRGALKAVAEEAGDIGINFPLLPVLDVNQNPDNPIICTRAFSDKPLDVAWYGVEYIKALEGAGLISCAKHFPGHGDTPVDSHISLPVISKPYRDLMDVDIMPFTEAVRCGVGSVMVGHLNVPALDDRPACISKKIIDGVLRKKLGFKGMVITDALNMSALRNIADVPAECINAGVDVLLHPADADTVVRELAHAVRANKVSERRIDEALERILQTKARIRNIPGNEVNYQSNAALSAEIAEMSMTLVKNKAGLLPLADSAQAQLVFAGDSSLYGFSPLLDCFRSGMPGNGDLLILAIFSSVAAWKGTSGINAEEKKRLDELICKAGKSVVVSFGSPYILRHFSRADALIAAYEPTVQAQRAVMKCLKGEIEFKGRLPVTLH